MATVTGLTAARMAVIEGASIVSGEVVGDDLILTKNSGATVNAGSLATLYDTPTQTLSVTSHFKTLGGSAVSLGSGGYANMHWRRIGRDIMGTVEIIFKSTATFSSNTMPFLIDPAGFPFAPRNFGLSNIPGSFGYVSSTDVGIPMGSVLTTFGNALATPAMAFFHCPVPGDGNLGNLWTPSNPNSIVGKATGAWVRFHYEAADAQ